MPTSSSPEDDIRRAGPRLPALRALAAAIPQAPIPAQIEVNSEQIMLGGRPLQDIAAELHGDARSWRAHRLELRAPGTTQVSLSEAGTQESGADSSRPRSASNSSDPDTLMAWLQGRSDIGYRSPKPLRLPATSPSPPTDLPSTP